jgi:hypothetical protein
MPSTGWRGGPKTVASMLLAHASHIYDSTIYGDRESRENKSE